MNARVPVSSAAKPASQAAAQPAPAAHQPQVTAQPPLQTANPEPALENTRLPDLQLSSIPNQALPPAAPGLSHNLSHIQDQDQARALLTQLLLNELAPRLGLDVSKIKLSIGADSSRELNAHAAAGMQKEGKILLHPHYYRPQTARGRYLLVHEMVHLAQRELPPRARWADLQIPADLREEVAHDAEIEAELEADRVARTVLEGGHYQALQAWLPPALPVFAEADAFEASFQEKKALIKRQAVSARQRERELIERYLRGIVTDGDVFKILSLLDGLPFFTAVGVIASLDAEQRKDLIDNINPTHVEKNQRATLACLAAIDAPDQLQVIDLDIFRALNDGNLSPEEYETAVQLLRGLSSAQRQKVLRMREATAARRLMFAPELSRKDKIAVLTLEDEALQKETELAERQQGLEKVKDQELLDLIRAKLKKKEFAAALQALVAKNDADTTSAIGMQLDRQGLLEDWLEELAQMDWLSSSEKTKQTLAGLVESRILEKNARLIEKLLSTGLFDWKVREYEVRFSYLLLQLLPIEQQYQFKRRENGEWYRRLEDKVRELNGKGAENLGRPLPDAQQISKEELRRLRAQYPEAVQDLPVLNEAIESYFFSPNALQRIILRHSKQLLDELKSEFTYLRRLGADQQWVAYLIDKLVGVGAASPARIASFEPNEAKPPGWSQPESGQTTDYRLRAAVVQALDSEGHIDWLLSITDLKYLLDEQHAQLVFELMKARDPARLLRYCAVEPDNEREALLAAIAMQALPDEERKTLLARQPDLWSEIISELSGPSQQLRFLNPYHGDQGGFERGEVMRRLTKREYWTEEKADLLEAQILLALTLREHKFVFDQSRKMFETAPAPIGKVGAIVDRYGLWKKGVRNDYVTENDAKGGREYSYGYFKLLFFNTRLLYVKNATALKLDLNKAGISGVNFAQAGKGGNEAYFSINDDLTSADLGVPELLIDQGQFQLAGGAHLKFGAVQLRNLRLHADFDSNNLERPVQVKLVIGGIELHGLTYSQASSAVAIALLQTAAIRAQTSELGADVLGPIPGFGQKGTPLPLPIILLFPQLLAAAITAVGANALISTSRGGTGGPLSKNVILNKLLANLKGDARQIELSVGMLDINGLATSGGLQLGHLRLETVKIGVGTDNASRLAMELESLNQRISYLESDPNSAGELAQLKKRRDDINSILPTEQKKAKKLRELRILQAEGKLDPAQSAQFERDWKEFQGETRGFLDINRVLFDDLDTGSIRSKDRIELRGLHGEGASQAFAGQEALGKDGKNLPARDSALYSATDSGQLTLNVRSIHTGRLEIFGAARALQEIDDRLIHLQEINRRDSKEYKELLALRPDAEYYQALLQRGIGNLDAEQLLLVDMLREKLGASLSLSIESIDAKNVQAVLDQQGQQASLNFGSLDITGIETASGLKLQSVHAEDLGISAGMDFSLLEFKKWRKYLKSGQLQAKILQLHGLSKADSGLLINDITFNSPKLSLVTGKSGFGIGDEDAQASLRISAGATGEDGKKVPGIVVQGASLAFSESVLRMTLMRLQAYDPKTLSPQQKTNLQQAKRDIGQALGQLDKLRAQEAKSTADLAAAKTDKARKNASKKLGEAQSALAEWRNQAEVEVVRLFDLDLQLLELGDVLSEDFDVDTLLDKGIHLVGAGADQQILGGAEIEGLKLRSGNKTTGVKKVSFGALKGEAFYSTTMTRLKLGLADISLEKLDYIAPRLAIRCMGKAKLSDIKFDATLHTPKEKDGEKPPLRVEIHEFSIGEMRGNKISYASDGDDGQMRVEMTTGVFKDIWLKNIEYTAGAGELDSGKLVEKLEKGIPSGAHVGSASLNILASVGKDLSGRANLQARDLNVHFFSDGKKEISLAQLRINSGKVFKKNEQGATEYDVDFAGAVNGINISIAKEGKLIVFSARRTDLNAKGDYFLHKKSDVESHADQISFDTTLKNMRTGNVVITDTSYRLNNFRIQSLRLNKFDAKGDAYRVRIRNGGYLELQDLALDLEVKRNPFPGKDKPALQQIILRRLSIPKTVASGVSLNVGASSELQLQIDIGNGKEASINGIDIKPPGGDNPQFTLTPGKDWQIEGKLEIASIIAAGTAMRVGDMFNGQADLGVNGLKMNFLKEGGRTLELEHVSAREVAGILAGGNLEISAAISGKEAGINLRNFFYQNGVIDKDETLVKFDALEVVGADYVKKAKSAEEETLAVYLNAWIRDVRVRKFKQGGRDALEAAFAGDVIGSHNSTSFNISLDKKLDTGVVYIDADKVVAPNVKIPSLKLNSLNVKSAGMQLEARYGGGIEFQDLSMDLKLELNPNKGPGEPGIKKLYLRKFKAPKTIASDFDLKFPTADKGDIQISVPANKSAVLENLELLPGKDAEGFSYEFGNSLTSHVELINGAVAFARFATEDLHVVVPKAIDATAGLLEVHGFQLDFISDPSNSATRIKIDKAKAKDIQAKILDEKNTTFSMLYLGQGANGLEISGIRKEEDGTFSIDALHLSDAKFEHLLWGLSLSLGGIELNKTDLKKALTVKNGLITIPELRLARAGLHIDDLMKVGSSADKKDSKSLGPSNELFNFLNYLDGDISFNIELEYSDGTTTFFAPETIDLKLHIKNGTVDYAKLEEQVLETGNIADAFVDFEYDDGTLAIELDGKPIAYLAGAGLSTVSPGLGGKILRNAHKAKYDYKKYKLSQDELKRVDGDNLPISAYVHLLRDEPGTTVQDPNEKSKLKDIIVSGADVNLSLKGGATIDLAHLNKDNLRGKINLGKEGEYAVESFKATGSTHIKDKNDRWTVNTQGFAFALGKIKLSIEGLHYIGDPEPAGNGKVSRTNTIVNVGDFNLDRVDYIQLGFTDVQADGKKGKSSIPKSLDVRASDAVARGIEIRIEKDLLDKEGQK